MSEDFSVEEFTKMVRSWKSIPASVMCEFVCRCAELILLREREAGREPSPRLWWAVEMKRKWLKGEISNEELDDVYEWRESVVRSSAWRHSEWVGAGSGPRGDDSQAARWAATAVMEAVSRGNPWEVADSLPDLVKHTKFSYRDMADILQKLLEEGPGYKLRKVKRKDLLYDDHLGHWVSKWW